MVEGVGLFSLAGKSALVTGATGYLGREMVKCMAAAGATVYVNSRSKDRADELVEMLRDAGGTAYPAVFDVTDTSAIQAFFKLFGCKSLNVLVNNAYIGGGGSIEHCSSSDYQESYSVAVRAAHDMLCAALPSLRIAVKEKGEASVINVGSMYGLVSPDPRLYATPEVTNPPFYGAAKAALLQWSRYAACEFGAEGIRVNSLSPGPFPSEMIKTTAPQFVDALASKVPLGRVGNAEEVQGPVLFLASTASSFVNGANLVVDGGWTSW